MRLSESVIVGAAPSEVWRYLSDLDNYPGFLSGFTRWDAEGGPRTGLGARRRMLFKVGSAEIGGLIEFVEWDEPSDLAWTSVTGVDQRARLRLRQAGRNATRVELRYAYGVAGSGIPGWIAEHVAARPIAGHLRRSLKRLKSQVERDASPTPARPL